MKRSIISQYDQLKGRLHRYAAMLHYRYLNLCIKAEAAALIPVNVIIYGEGKNIEEVAEVAIPDDYHLDVIPKDDEHRDAIIQAVTVAHPEFKPSMNTVEIGGKDKQYMEYEMPEVDKSRRDFLNETVKSLYDEAKIKIDTTYHEEQAGFAEYLRNNPDQLDEVNKNLDQVYDKALKSIQGSRDDKLQEIEEGYIRYLNQQSSQQDAEDNPDFDVTQSMKMDS